MPGSKAFRRAIDTVTGAPSALLPGILAVLAVIAYLAAIDWGLPGAIGPESVRPWGHDELAPLGPLAEFHNTFVQPKPDRYLAYPLWHYWIILIAYAPYLLYLILTGGLSDPTPGFPFGFADPAQALRNLTLIARFVTVLMAAGTVLIAFHTGRALAGRQAGVLAALFVMLLYPMFYYGRTSNLDVPALFWSAAGILVFVTILSDGLSVRRAAWLGIFAAMAAGTKDLNAVLFFPMPLVILWRRTGIAGTAPGNREWRALARAFGITFVVGLLAYLVTSGFVFRPERYVAHVKAVLGLGPQPVELPRNPASWYGIWQNVLDTGTWLVVSTNELMFLVAVAAVAFAVRRRHLAVAFVIPSVVLLLLLIAWIRSVQMRFILAASYSLACTAAVGMAWAQQSTRRSVRAAAIVLTSAIIAISSIRAIELTHAMRADSRYAAATWLDANLSDEAVVGFFGPAQKLPSLPDRLRPIPVVPYPGRAFEVPSFDTRDFDIAVEALRRLAPDALLLMPDHSSSAAFPFGNSMPHEFVERLFDGSVGYRLGAYLETPPLLAGWARRPLA